MVTEKFDISGEEKARFIKAYFREGENGPLSTFPTKEKRKIAILRQLAGRFDPNRKYTEKEVNGILCTAFHDHVTLRRNLIEYGFLDRDPDGSSYWVKSID